MTLTEQIQSLEESKVKTYNDGEGTLTGYDCPLCKNRGSIAYLKDGVFTVKDCECLNRRRSLRRMEASGLKPVLETYTFDNFVTEKDWQKKAKAKAMSFALNPSGWFVITGYPGTGKTHLCTAICGFLLEQNKSIRYMLWREDAPKIKSCITDTEKYNKLMSDYKNCDVLYIDDFWKGSVTDADINLSFELLNSRYNDRSKITILSGERTVEEMLDIDMAIGSRIYELSKGNLIKTPEGVENNYRLR